MNARNRMLLAITVAAGLALSACGGSSGSGGDAFNNSLAFGTGITGNGFVLSGESTTFPVATTRTGIYFRLESSANFDGRFVRLYFNNIENMDFSGCAGADAHICLANFSVSNPGTYVVKAYLVRPVLDIGTETYVTQTTLTVTP